MSRNTATLYLALQSSLSMLNLIIFILVVGLFEFYVYRSLLPHFHKRKRIFQWTYLASVVLFISTVATMMVVFSKGYSNSALTTNLMMGTTFSFFVAKIILAAIFLVYDVYRLIKAGVQKAAQPKRKVSLESRRKFITNMGLTIAAIPFSGLLYGTFKGKYDYTVHRTTLWFPDLPDQFDGFTLAQVSDIHSGSFDSVSAVERGVQMIQDQNPDLILFTGDLVNNYAKEVEPYMHLFQRLEAPHGKFSVMGNHDYGTYVEWDSEEAWQKNIADLEGNHEKMGFKLLNNRNVTLEKNGQAIRLLGVENWGNPPFPQKGDLDLALQGTNANEFSILMSHDPDHWQERVLPHNRKIHLTLSGHTHGSQMGIEIPGFRWSPVQYRYDRWAGLYEEQNQYLYVNRGFGFLGYPGRAGIWPEITVIELRKGDQPNVA